VRYISIDPGRNNGVATFNAEGSEIKRCVYSIEYLKIFLEGTVTAAKPVTFIVEDFNLRQDKALEQTGSEMPAPRVIGMVEFAVTMLGRESKMVMAKSANLRTALKWAGYPELANKPRNWHCPDELSAYAHGMMYLIQQGIVEHPIWS
jgi:hypothetical protein